MPEQLFERLNQKVAGLENLNGKRKALLEEFTTAINSDDLEEKKQSLLSYTRTREAALKTSLDLLQQASRQLSNLCISLQSEKTKARDPTHGCSSYEFSDFYDAMNKLALSNSLLSEGRVALLKEGKMLEETILKVPHETKEETTTMLKNVQDSYLQVKNANLSRFVENMHPILNEYLAIQERSLIRDEINCMVIKMQDSFNDYARKVHEYNMALQSLTDHLIT